MIRLLKSIGSASFLIATTTQLALGAVFIEWERSADLKLWERVPPTELQMTATGGLLLPNGSPQSFYRLRVNNGTSAGYIQAVTLSQAPKQAVAIANTFLQEQIASGLQKETLGLDWPEDAQLGPMCYPVFDPGFENGLKPAYMEFKVIRKPREVQALQSVPPPGALGLSAPQEANDPSFGYILIALHPGDVPVPEFSDQGLTKIERLLGNVRVVETVKPIRFDGGLIFAENERGQPVGSLGSEPFQIDPNIVSIAGQEFSGSADPTGAVVDKTPQFAIKGFESYDQLKKEFASNPLYQFLRAERALRAKPQWTIANGETPEVFRVPLRQSVQVLIDQKIQTAAVDDPKLVTVSFKPGGAGITLTGNATGGTLLHVRFTDDTTGQYILSVAGAQSPQAIHAADWSAWSYSYAGSWGDQRRYQQFDRDPQMCTGGASGCGPTAWAMLYGWWDLRGSPRLIGSTSLADAPLNNNDFVRECTRYVFSRVGPLCVSGQAATMPWSMAEGYRWAGARGAGYSITWNWGVPYVSPGVRNKARDSIRAGRPSIVGLGFYSHYPLAYGYATRNYVWAGITWDTSHYFKCNMGWGGSSPEWQDGSSFWFATNARYF